MESGKIIKWLKKEGDRVQSGDILAEVETDKADVEMEAFGSGVLRKILQPAGSTVPGGLAHRRHRRARRGHRRGGEPGGRPGGAGGVSRAGRSGPRGRGCNVEPSRRGPATAPPRGSRRAHAVTGERTDRADANGAGRRGSGDRPAPRRRREPGAR